LDVALEGLDLRFADLWSEDDDAAERETTRHVTWHLEIGDESAIDPDLHVLVVHRPRDSMPLSVGEIDLVEDGMVGHGVGVLAVAELGFRADGHRQLLPVRLVLHAEENGILAVLVESDRGDDGELVGEPFLHEFGEHIAGGLDDPGLPADPVGRFRSSADTRDELLARDEARLETESLQDVNTSCIGERR